MKSNFSEYYRPQSLEDFLGQEHLLGEGKVLRILIENRRLSSAIFWGPPGCGKTTLAKIIANLYSLPLRYINASFEGSREIKDLVKKLSSQDNLFQSQILLIVDELHRFSRPQQDTLLEAVERGWIILIGITTESPYATLSPPLLSRTHIFKFKPLSKEELWTLLDKVEKGLEFSFSLKAKEYLILRSRGDARKLLQLLEIISVGYKDKDKKELEVEEVKELLSGLAEEFSYSANEHYDVASAFIKSMRGSDPDAALYWLAQMIEFGENPEFIARRILIHAAEDVGLANPMALVLAQAAVDAVKQVGWPEARIILAEAVLYITLSPKSNSAIKSIDKALKYIKDGKILKVPDHLKNNHPASQFYKYPHNYPDGWVEQKYLPEDLKIYDPVLRGVEKRLVEKLRETSQR